jgi:hypothetical protein
VIQEPVQPTLMPNPSSHARRNTITKFGLLIVAILLLAIPILLSMGANAAPTSQPLAAGASTAPNATGEPLGGQGRGPAYSGPKAWLGSVGHMGIPGLGSHIEIRAISGSQISLATVDGWSRTITATSTTVITKGGQTIAVADLNVGDEIHFRQTRNDDGTYAIAAIDVPVPHTRGEVTKVDGNDITIKQRGGTSQVITVTGSTVYKLGSAAGSKSDVKVGSDIDAAGTISGTAFTATAVSVRLVDIDGQVTDKTTSSITVKDHAGDSKTIHVTSSTTFKVKGKAPASLSDISVGDRVSADGTLRTDGSLDAVAVHGSPPRAVKPPKAPASSAAPG